MLKKMLVFALLLILLTGCQDNLPVDNKGLDPDLLSILQTAEVKPPTTPTSTQLPKDKLGSANLWADHDVIIIGNLTGVDKNFEFYPDETIIIRDDTLEEVLQMLPKRMHPITAYGCSTVDGHFWEHFGHGREYNFETILTQCGNNPDNWYLFFQSRDIPIATRSP